MLCPPLRFVPPPNFVGSVAFDIALANPTEEIVNGQSQTRPADSILETATVQRSVLTTVGLPECMQDAAAVRRTPESFCGEHGVCRGPTGCACDSHWFGVRTTPPCVFPLRLSCCNPMPAGAMRRGKRDPGRAYVRVARVDDHFHRGPTK